MVYTEIFDSSDKLRLTQLIKLNIIIIIIINEFHRDASLKQNFRAAEVLLTTKTTVDYVFFQNLQLGLYETLSK